MARIIIIALVAVGLFAVIRSLLGGGRGRTDVKCATCIHCRQLYRDGVLCGFEQREVFKNPTHIEMCPDHDTRGFRA